MRQLFKDKNFLCLCLAAFFMSSCQQLIWVAMPFIVKSLHGSDTDVGLCFMAQMAVYVFFCIWAGVIAHRLRPKKVLIIGSIGQIFVTSGIFAVVWFSCKLFVGPVTQLVFLMSMIGIITAFYWPVIMGWISKGHEGAELTKRFGLYNVTWGMANMLLPIVGGYLMEVNYLMPIAGAFVMMFGGLASVYFLTKPSPRGKNRISKTGDVIIEQLNPLNMQFVWVSRVALLTMYTCVGIYRSQLGILYKYELGFGESIYGWSVSMMCLLNVVVFFLMGRSHWWHYKKGFYAVSQLLIVISLLMIIFSRNVFIQLLASGLAGITYAAIYSSHQYYGVAGGRNRSGKMAIHETIIGAGYAGGSILGGIISDHFGRHWPYVFGCIIVAAAGIIQIAVWFSLGRKNTSPLANP
ncbi:MAG: MFS transporter [Planctomycetaceae bacterium]|nr:MFS transporter [Planctomycetaceae bacterium]